MVTYMKPQFPPIAQLMISRHDYFLIIAMQTGNGEAAMYGLGNGADQSTPDKRGMTPLVHAVRLGYFRIVEQLLDGKDINQPLKNSDNTLLLSAASQGNPDTVALLLEKGADPDIGNRNKFTPLMVAADAGHAAVVDHLLAAGADVNLASVPAGRTALTIAAWQGHADIVRKLLAAGANINTAEPNGMTPLILAAYGEHPETVRVLIDAGADTTRAAENGKTALDMAAGNEEIVNLLRTP